MNKALDKQNLRLAKVYDFCKSGAPKLTVVFIHGIAASSASFNGLLGYLENKESMAETRFVAFDLLGAGKSYASDELNYDFKEQIDALSNSIKELDVKTPLIIIAHSMGTMIAARYAVLHRSSVDGLILVSPPIYRKEDIENPMFGKAMDGFREIVAHKNREVVKTKAFNNEIDLIISDSKNYDYFVKLAQPTTIIYGELDTFIAPFNIPRLLKENPDIATIKTPGSHGVTRDKYAKVLETLEKLRK